MAALVNNPPDVLPTPKQIRFVNNQGQPPTKRRRINAACLTCRKRKTRCAGEHPTCSTCTRNGHVCLGYSDGTGLDKKRDPDGAHGSTHLDPDDEDYLDDEPDLGRRHSKDQHHRNENNEHNGNKPFEAGRMSDPAQDYATPTMQFKTERIDWDGHHSEQSQPTPRPGILVRRPTNSSTTEDGRSPTSRSPVQHRDESSHRVPYFRYFGPTAIVPGFKQMVVKVRDRRRSSISATSPTQPDHELGHIEDMPLYDPTDENDVSPVILDLVDTFFLRLGSNYPFLRRDKFPSLVREKRVEPILVDAVCASAARFSDIPVFRRWNDGKLAKSEYGQVYAQRAKEKTVETFPCPSVAAVQACLLMAYVGFGADQDSALWMYLGVAIRMAVDLGLTKKDGVKYRNAKGHQYGNTWPERQASDDSTGDSQSAGDEDTLSPEEQKEFEQERVDTFWSLFFLDRAISSGTGRPVTLKDDDFDLELPKSSINSSSGWPDPYASLLRILHLYGRVSDVLNNISHPEDLTRDRLSKLVQLENELTNVHQKMDSRLRFDAKNFKAHVDNGQGTTFILLHFWFHASIIVLHQPTLLTGSVTIDRKHQLKPHSRELSMSSAKTITDILAFAELLDPKCFIGNPFTSQPIYIAACAFIMESKNSPSHPTSRNTSPPPELRGHEYRNTLSAADMNASSKHLLLAQAATHNYQRCYKALKQMHAYWGGVRYILTALDFKSNGQWECETFTTEEYESTRRDRRNSAIQRFGARLDYPASPMPDNGPLAWSLTGTTNSPKSSLTLLFQNPVANGGMIQHHHQQQHQQQNQHQHQHYQHHRQVMQSPQQTAAPIMPTSAPTPPGNMIYDPIRQSLPPPPPESTSMYPPAYPQPNTSALRHSVSHPRRVSGSSMQGKSHLRYEGFTQDDVSRGPSTPDRKLGMSLPSQGSTTGASMSYAPSPSAYDPSSFTTGASPSSTQSQAFANTSHSTPGGGTSYSSDGGPSNFAQSGSGLAGSGYSYMGPDLHLQTYDNETDIGQYLTSFEHTDMMSWFGDYFPNDVLGFYSGDSSLG
ncbi:Uu.00g077120.m01.CDS01 [Anthostomella pinea]|uniref:Uu.00g077120.m01.CDS01 n=1 Tax=Anthostomella pinea TaxID=933095 RepID=A0AAI8VW02_9PEZI|nr:Uu.00g077120.m01.CDS01 [Anthostomella pinea]